MTVIPDKHTFTIWQGATFSEVLTLYESLDKTLPRNFHASISGITATVASNLTVTLSVTSGNINSKLENNKRYYISSSQIPAANEIYFTTGAVSAGTSYTITNLSSTTGLTAGSSTATIKYPNYYAEMIIRSKPQADSPNGLLALRTYNHPNYNSANDALITLPSNADSMGQIILNISDTKTATLGTSTSWKAAVYDLTITDTSVSPNVTDALLYGGIKVNGV